MLVDTLSPEEKEKIETVMRLSQLDQDFRKRIIADPKSVFIGIGFNLPNDISVVVYDVPPKTIGFVLPPPLFKS